jgi:D-alanyl-D-alanine carboxypeptidase
MKRTLPLILSLIALIALGTSPVIGQDANAALTAALRAYTADAFTEGNTAAVTIGISLPDGEQIRAAAGMRDGVQPAQPEDRFRIASMSKTFVAVTALLMAEDELLSLDDPAAAYLPDEVVTEIANLSGADGAVIRDLLGMQSGIDDYLGTDAFWEVLDSDPGFPWTASAALTYAYGLPPLFDPGEQVSYSNTNYLLMELILGEAGGAPLHELVRAYILDPLGLQNTYTQARETLADMQDSAFVRGYEDWDEDGFLEDVSAINDGFGLGDGALISTAGDLITFYRALLDDRTLLSAESLAQMMDFTTDAGGTYGLGLSEFATPVGTAYGHTGAVLGFGSLGLYLPDQDTVLVVLCATWECDAETLVGMALTASAE